MNNFESWIHEARRILNKKVQLEKAQNLIKRTAAAKPCEILRGDETYAYTVALILQHQFPELLAVYKADGPLAPVALQSMKDLTEMADMVASVAVQRVKERTNERKAEHWKPEPKAETPEWWKGEADEESVFGNW